MGAEGCLGNTTGSRGILTSETVRQRIKDILDRENEKGWLLWMRRLWRYMRNASRFVGPRSLLNLMYYMYLLKVKKCRRLQLGPCIKRGIFYVCREQEGDRACVHKIPHLHTRVSCSLYRKLRNKRAFADYRAALLMEGVPPTLRSHFPRVTRVDRDGGYQSSYVPGYNLLEIRNMARDGAELPPDVEPSEIDMAIDELVAALKASVGENRSLCGDWALHNLVYDKKAKRIVNVDVEGRYTYQYPALATKLAYIEPVLRHAQAVLEMTQTQDEQAKSILHVMSIVARATESDASYSGQAYPVGYHSLTLRGRYFRGQRDCSRRLAEVPYDFAKKTVLDLGCNCGGMLHCLADRIRAGVGLDRDGSCINAANLIKFVNGTPNLHFFTFDMEREPLSLIHRFVLGTHIDICFLLSVCMWIRNWRGVIRYVASISDTLLFEANGSEAQQAEQVRLIRSCFQKVALLSPASFDDLKQTCRALYLCEAPELSA